MAADLARIRMLLAILVLSQLTACSHGPYTQLTSNTLPQGNIACRNLFELNEYLAGKNSNEASARPGDWNYQSPEELRSRLIDGPASDPDGWKKASCLAIHPGDKIKDVKFLSKDVVTFLFALDPTLVKAEGIDGTWYTLASNID